MKASRMCFGTRIGTCAILSDEVFSTIDELVRRLDNLNQPFGRVCALVLFKARNFGLDCYSLLLDALGQESGALLAEIGPQGCIEYIH